MQFDMIKMVPEPGERPDLTKPVPYATYQCHINRYIFVSKFVSGKSVLDVGCGAGTGVKYWLTKGARKVTGVDISEDAIRRAKVRHKGINRATFALADAQALPFGNDSFDVIVSLEAIEHLSEPEKFLLECRRVIKTGGTFICSTPNKKVTTPLFKRPANPYHVKEFCPAEFSAMVSCCFGAVTDYGQCLLKLKDRIKPGFITVTMLLLARVPGGDSIRKLLRRIGKFALVTPHLPEFREDFDEMADKVYEVIPFEDGLFKTPETLITVAEAVDK